MSSDLAYLSIIEWPDGLDESRRVQGLVRGAGMDLHAARMAVRRGTPQVIGRMDAALAQRAVDNLHAIGATAFAPRRLEMEAAPEPFQAKRLIPAEGSPEPMYACEAWRGEGRSLRMPDVFLIVRATLATSESRTTVNRPLDMASVSMISGLGGLAIAGGFGGAGASAGHSTQISTAGTLDLWLRDGSRLRIDGRRFSFDLLGDQRGLTDRDNIDLLVARLLREAPRVILDTGFADFRCPPDVMRSHFIDTGTGSVRRTTDAPVFEFYSTWAAILYRLMLPPT